jgi:hypothetical protein
MEKEFVPYELALRMKQLGFDEPCLGKFYYNELEIGGNWCNNDFKEDGDIFISAPLYQQGFRFFREKYNLKSCIMFRTSMEDDKEYYDWLIKGQEVVYRHFNTPEEAELACLTKLIEIVESKTE